MKYINRTMEKQIIEASKNYPIVMVCGQRQVGKSTMLNHIKDSNRKYVSLDDRNARRLAHNDPDLFFETYGYPIIIDEFQKEPAILEKIKDIVDKLSYEGKDNSGLFWLTGSQKFKMMKNITESLAGRVAVFELSTFSQAELNNMYQELFIPNIEVLKHKKYSPLSLHQLYERIFKGGMPKVNTTNINREKYYSDYINTYIERDIRELEQVGKLTEFYDFLVYMASRTAQELHYDDISKSIGISAPTAKSWVSILERSGIIFILRPYYNKITDRLIKTPKVYFMDTGLAAYLCRWPNPETLANGNMDGAFLETFVVSEIVKSYYNNGKPINNLYYYRDIDKKEIDLLIVDAENIYPIEIKKNKTPNHPDKNFYVLEKFKLNVKPGLIICLTDELIPYNKNCWYCPTTLI